MKKNRSQTPTSKYFEIQEVYTSDKSRHSDSPTPSILKIPTPIFVTSRNSSTKRLKFANGPVDLQTLKNGSHKSESCLNESLDNFENIRTTISNGESILDNSLVEVAVSPRKTMQVSPETWKAFLEYKKYNDYSNETEKTDYTYSRLSKFRHKEIIPGFLIRPNLCRTSISSKRSSSVFLPSSQSPLRESYSYEFKVHSEPKTGDDFDFKTPNFGNKVFRSKYNLRSSSYDDASVGEIEGKPLYFEQEYFSNSAPESFFKRAHSSSIGSEGGSFLSNKMKSVDVDEGGRRYSSTLRSEDLDEAGARYSTKRRSEDLDEAGARYSTKLRSMDMDDLDIDEVDDNVVGYKKQWCSGDERGLQKPQTVSQYLSNFFSAIFLYVTSFGTLMSDQFSKRILRKNNEFDHSSYMASRKNLNFPYANAGRGGSFSSWSNETPYYYSGDYLNSQRTWYQKVYYYFYDKFMGVANLIRGGSSPRYASSRYVQETSRKRKFWWLLIPLLLLAGFWLFKAEQQNGFISEQYEALNDSLNGFFTPLENALKQTWRWFYTAYKRMAANASCYVNDSWERLKLPFTHISEILGSGFSALAESSLGFVIGFFNKLWEGSANILKLFLEAFSSLLWFLLGFLSDFLSAITNVLHNFYAYIVEGFAWSCEHVWKGLRNVFSSLGLLLFAPRQTAKVIQPPGDSCKIQQSSVDTLKSEMIDLKSLTWDLAAIRKKIDELEDEIRRQKELAESRNDLYDKQLDNNLKALQKYQDMVNYALISTKKPGNINHSTMQYFLNNQAAGLKQWITQNFLLKSDSAIDENKIGLYMAQYSNKTGEELMALKNEFKTFVINHKHELENLKKEYSTMATTDLGQSDISLAFIKKLVQDAIKLYDADKTGKVDFALETAGGQVISIRCSETYLGSPVSYTLLGWSVYSKSSSPRDAISPSMAPGQCWAFAGSQGYLVLQLSHTIQVTGFTMEHVSKSLVPKGHFESAPKNFSMWGLKSVQDPEPYLFGEYMYLDNDETVQYFQVVYPTTQQYNIVELKITSNYGNLNYTCLYRIRVHGDVVPLHSKPESISDSE